MLRLHAVILFFRNTTLHSAAIRVISLRLLYHHTWLILFSLDRLVIAKDYYELFRLLKIKLAQTRVFYKIDLFKKAGAPGDTLIIIGSAALDAENVIIGDLRICDECEIVK